MFETVKQLPENFFEKNVKLFFSECLFFIKFASRNKTKKHTINNHENNNPCSIGCSNCALGLLAVGQHNAAYPFPKKS
jgi:hypothetical protein